MRLFQKGYATIGSFTRVCVLVTAIFNRTTENFIILRSNYTMEVYPVLHESLVSKMGPKCKCLVDFCTTSLPTMHEYMHVHCY